MNDTEKIKNELGAFAAKYGPATIVPAVVLAVNNDDTIQIEFSDESIVDDARLKSVVAGGNKVLLIPKVNSIVQVGKIENSDEYVVIAVHEISEVLTEIGGVRYSMNDVGFIMEKGGDSVKQILLNIIQATKQIFVMYGNNPDYTKLDDAENSTNNLFR